jgi:hypothetical protein
MKLKELEREVRGFLISNPQTRASDDLLYAMLIEGRLQRMGKSLQRISAHDYLLHYRKYGLPTIESVGRCRRKIQKKDENLKPVESVELHRKEMQNSFVKYAVGALGLTF